MQLNAFIALAGLAINGIYAAGPCHLSSFSTSIASSTPTTSPELPTTSTSTDISTTTLSTTSSEESTSTITSTDISTTTLSTTSSGESTSTTTSTSTTSAPETIYTGGFATFFYQNGNYGSCGNFHADRDFIAALSYSFGPALSDVLNGKYCGRSVRITNSDNGHSVDAIIADTCPTCSNANSLDLSLGAFDALGSEDEGQLPIVWKFI
ncbi:RlpA-like double-psi beta-barrel-protein domain-containing protein-containing protein [Ilyonectria destructans]|nr:RlpA-like double-psi beta-barrel-protein domain-containing protein-containing protein [Ilyonectria destructans]